MTKSVGIELSDSMVRLAVVEKKGKAVRILGYFENVIPPDEKTPWPERAQPILKDLLSRGGVPKAGAVASIDSGEIMSRVITVPFKDDAQIRKTIKGELETHLTNVSAEDIVVDFQKIGETDRGSTLLTAAAPKELLAARLAALASVGVEPARVDLDTEGLVYGLASAGGLDKAEPLLVVHGSPKFAKLLLVEKKRVKNLRTIRFSMPEPGQETQRRSRPKDTRAYGGPVPLIILAAEEPTIESAPPDSRAAMLTVLAKEIQRFILGAGAAAPVEIILSGEFESVAVGKAIQGALKLPVRLVNVLKGLEHPFDKPELQVNARRKIVTPLGLALRALSTDADAGMDFRQEEFAYQGRAEAAAGTFLVTLELVLVLIAAFGLSRYLELRDLRAELGRVEERKRRLLFDASGIEAKGDVDQEFKHWIETEYPRRGQSDYPVQKSAFEHLCEILAVVRTFCQSKISERPTDFFLEVKSIDCDLDQYKLSFAAVSHGATDAAGIEALLKNREDYKRAKVQGVTFNPQVNGYQFTIDIPMRDNP